MPAPEWHALQVGQPYHPQRTRWPEGAHYAYRAGHHELLLFLDSPTAREIAAVRTGAPQCALYTDDAAGLLVLLYQFGASVPWSDAPFSWHLLPAAERVVPPLSGAGEESRALLQAVLVDAATGTVQAIRAVTLTPAFTAQLHAAIRRQAARPWDRAAYDRALDALYQRYPTTRALLAATTARSRGGA